MALNCMGIKGTQKLKTEKKINEDEVADFIQKRAKELSNGNSSNHYASLFFSRAAFTP